MSLCRRARRRGRLGPMPEQGPRTGAASGSPGRASGGKSYDMREPWRRHNMDRWDPAGRFSACRTANGLVRLQSRLVGRRTGLSGRKERLSDGGLACRARQGAGSAAGQAPFAAKGPPGAEKIVFFAVGQGEKPPDRGKRRRGSRKIGPTSGAGRIRPAKVRPPHHDESPLRRIRSPPALPESALGCRGFERRGRGRRPAPLRK